ncbi:MAG: hypothetical protein QXR60_04105, partial [Candidatus Nanoarchaeia archaeon]
FCNDAGYVTLASITWQNLSGTPPPVSTFANDAGYFNSTGSAYLYSSGSTIFLNESVLNSTVSKLTGIMEEYTNISVSAGTGTASTTLCCFPKAEILQIQVVPATPTNKYRFSAYSTTSYEAVDTDRMMHSGNWTVSHKGSVVIGETVTYSITNALVDEDFVVRLRWRAG